MDAEAQKLHFILFPMMAPGHMNPIIDITKLLAGRRLIVSVTTPGNVTRIDSAIHTTVASGLQIHLIQVRFPAAEAGLPAGFENIDSFPSMDMSDKFMVALNMMQNDIVRAFEELRPMPSCLISDFGLSWKTQIADKFSIPRIIFHGTSCISLLCSHQIKTSAILDSLSSDSDRFEVPNLPDRIEFRKGQFNRGGAQGMKESGVMKEVLEQVKAAETTSYGVVVNSFEGLEAEYEKEYSKVKDKKVWCIGPVSLCNEEGSELAERGNKSAIDAQSCLRWLYLHEPRSVIYAALGSLARPAPEQMMEAAPEQMMEAAPEQMMEAALALEETNRPFIWGLGGASSSALDAILWRTDSQR